MVYRYNQLLSKVYNTQLDMVNTVFDEIVHMLIDWQDMQGIQINHRKGHTYSHHMGNMMHMRVQPSLEYTNTQLMGWDTEGLTIKKDIGYM
jgi:hypothetical protein